MEDGARFKRFIEGLYGMLTKVEISFVKEGLFFKAMNETRILFTEINVAASAFTEYICNTETREGEGGEEEAPITLGMELEDLNKILSSCGDNESVSVTYKRVEVEREGGGTEMAGDNKIKIHIEGREGAVPKRSRDFNLALVDIPDALKPEGSIELEEQMVWQAELPVGLLDIAIKDAEIVSNTIKIEIGDDGMALLAESSLSDYGESFSEAVDIQPLNDLEDPEPLTSEYQIAQLKSILKMSQQSGGNIFLQTGTADGSPIPLRIKFEVLGDGAIDNYLAPKADEDPGYREGERRRGGTGE
jgi:DNA polymerase III sliding clamp (beta) subunit (PCNA family)